MRENRLEKIEVHVSGVCIKNNEVLVGKRTNAREIYPGLWECGGGMVKNGESFEVACKRQFFEEYGINITIKGIVGTYFIDYKSNKIPGITFLCTPAEGQVLIIDRQEFSEACFFPFSEVCNYEFIPGVLEDINKGFAMIEAASSKSNEPL